VPAELKVQLRNSFEGLFILAGGFDQERAEEALVEKRADLIAFGRSSWPIPTSSRAFARTLRSTRPTWQRFTCRREGYTDYPT